MAPKILVTGVTGYIGGDAFYALYEAHPDYHYTLLVRSKEREEPVRKKYPNVENVKIVYPGETNQALGLTDVLEEEAKNADIVLHTAGSADDMSQATAILNGLQAANRPADNPAYWIHISGTAILQWYDQLHTRHGQPPLPAQKYDDVADIDRILAFPDHADHRDVDKVVLSANDSSRSIKTAIVAPPTIYGFGRGPANTVSMQIPALARFVLKSGYAPLVDGGKAEWDHTHVSDVSGLLVRLVERAVARVEGEEVFGKHAYYFCEQGSHVWGKVAAEVGEEAVRQGWLKEAVSKDVKMRGDDGDGKKIEGIGETWGLNSKGVSSRARKYLGWEPKGKGLKNEIPGAVEWEARKLGLEKII